MPGIDRDVGTAAALKPTVSSLFSCSVLPCIQLCVNTGADEAWASVQEGSVSEKDFEELVLRLHEIQVQRAFQHAYNCRQLDGQTASAADPHYSCDLRFWPTPEYNVPMHAAGSEVWQLQAQEWADVADLHRPTGHSILSRCPPQGMLPAAEP